MWGALSDERTDYNFCWSSPAQSFLALSPPGIMTTFHSLGFDIPPTWRVRYPVIISSRNRVDQLYLQVPGSLSVASCDSQGYGGGTRTRPHTRSSSSLKSKSKLCYNRWLVGQSGLVSNPHLGAQKQIFLTVRQFLFCWCGTPSLTSGRVRRLQMLLTPGNTVILGSEFHGTHDHSILLS
jgi:hypothetical protein